MKIRDVEIKQYVIQDSDLVAEFTDFGCCNTSLKYKGEEKILTHRPLEGYGDNGECFGCFIMPNANRIANGDVEIDGIHYQMLHNDHNNNLHTDTVNGCHKRLWKTAEVKENEITFTLDLKDGEYGLPGNRHLSLNVVLKDNAIIMNYSMISDKKTIFNPTYHGYFKLGGKGCLDHGLFINADYVTEVNNELIPNGKLVDVTGTPFDFRETKHIGKDVDADYYLLNNTRCYDHNFVLNGYDGTVKKQGELSYGNQSVEIYTDMPGLQIYSGQIRGVAMETQFFPDNIHHENFVSSVIEANTEVKHTTIYQFVEK